MNSFQAVENEDKIIKTPNLDYVPDPKGLGYVLYTQMQKHKENIAQIDGLTGEKDSYGSLLLRCIRTAITMRSKGVKPGDIITLCTFNHLNSAVPYFATFFLGATIASLDPTLSLTDTTDLLKQVTPKLLFVIPEAVEMIEKAVAEVSPQTTIVVFGNTANHTPFADFLQPTPEENTFQPFQTESLWETQFCVNHFAFLSQVVNTIGFGYCFDITLTYASYYWICSPLLWGVCIMKGTALLVLPNFNPALGWEIIDKYKPTFMFLVPTQLLAMYNHGRPDGVNTNSLKDLIIAGDSLSKEQMVNVRKLLPDTRIYLAHGQSEATGFLACFRPSNSEDMNLFTHKPTSSGRGLPGITYKVVDLETEEILGPNQEGELRIKTNFQFNGYHNRDSSDIWDPNGWLKTGDMVYYDEDFCFYIADRIKPMLIFQSWHVPPALIENVLLMHPAIKSAVVIGIPHNIDVEHPMGVVILKEEFDGKEVLAEEIEKFVGERVHDRQRLRAGVKIVQQLPITPSGKVKRKEVKNMILKNKI